MPWTSRYRKAGVPPAVRWAARLPALGAAIIVFTACGLVLICSIVLPAASPEKRLSVYSVAANYSLPMVQREGQEYVGLLEVLEPLGKVSARADGPRWRLRYYREEDDFQPGKTRARIQGRDLDLPAKFILENNRGLVPVAALSTLLPRILEIGRASCRERV